MAAPQEPFRKPGNRAVRPKDAATLIIYRRRKGAIEVLLGKRHASHRFLPSRYVFPGGRVDRGDNRVRAATPMRAEVAELLARKTTPARARGLVAAAVRETFEETGLIVGAPDPQPRRPAPANWRPFFATGMAPSFAAITYVARAVTPAWQPIRFNARFFMIEAGHVSGDLGGSGELLDLTFVPIGGTDGLELSLITTRVLDLVAGLARNPPAAGGRRTAILFHHNGEFHDMIEE
jgi:8-oxo-dGTP pyrophosphatase MutT (NUDIX family)